MTRPSIPHVGTPWRTVIVEQNTSERLDVWLTRIVPGLSRRGAAALIASEHVTVNGLIPVKSERVSSGCTVEIRLRPQDANWVPAPDGSRMLAVHYQDASIAVVEKPSGIASVPHGPDELGTLANFTVSMFPICAEVGRRPGDGGLLQRLDFETSGIVLVALSQNVHDALTAAQKRGDVTKRYLALAQGTVPETLTIDTPLEKTGPKGAKMRSSATGAAAMTTIRLTARLGNWSLVEAEILHGVRHQIRAHLSDRGFPIAGDSVYGDGRTPGGLSRLFLHAHEISFVHPVTMRPMTFRSPLPENLAQVLNRLKKRF